MIFCLGGFCRIANGRFKSRAIRLNKRKKVLRTLINDLCESSVEPRPDTLCHVLDKPDNACRLPDVFSAMANKIDSASRGIAPC